MAKQKTAPRQEPRGIDPDRLLAYLDSRAQSAASRPYAGEYTQGTIAALAQMREVVVMMQQEAR